MTALVSVATRLDSAMKALQPLMTSAELNENAAYARDRFSEFRTELVAAQRIVNGLIGSFTLANRRTDERRASLDGLIVIDGAPAAEPERVRMTFDCAARIPRNPWPPIAPDADSEGGEF